jgi:hypothetical protein
MSYNLRSLHQLYLHKIQTKKELKDKLKELNEKGLNESNEKMQLEQKLETQYKNVVETADEYNLQNIDLISILYDKDPNFHVDKEIYNDYVKRYFNHEVNLLKYNNQLQSSCEVCEMNNWIEDTKTDNFICLQCGMAKPANRVVVSYEKGLELKIQQKKNSYSKSKSLTEFLDYLQLKKTISTTTEEEKKIKSKLSHIPKEKIYVKLVQSAMQKLALNHLYNDKYYMFYRITGKKIHLSPGTERQIQFHFFLEQKAFEILKKKHERMNIFLYKYSVKKIIELILFKLQNPGYKPLVSPKINIENQYSEEVNNLSEVVEQELVNMINIIPQPIIMSFDNLWKYDLFWRTVCQYLGWRFISSF